MTQLPTETWPNPLAVAADLIEERGWSRTYLIDPVTGALAIDTALKVAAGYQWREQETDDGIRRTLTAPDKATSQLYNRLESALFAHIVAEYATGQHKVPSLGWWNLQVVDVETVPLALRVAAAKFEANRAKVARHRTGR